MKIPTYINGERVDDLAPEATPAPMAEDVREALRGPDKPRPRTSWWILPLAVLGIAPWVWMLSALWSLAFGATLQPQYDAAGRPYFEAQGPQCWTDKHGGQPMDCDEIDSIAEPAPFDVPRLIAGRAETPAETFARTGSYGYLHGSTLNDTIPAPVPLPAPLVPLAGALAGLIGWRKM